MMIEDWEKRQEHTPLEVHMVGPLAGCFAGLIEHISMLPLDNIKTHLQVLPGSKFWGTFKQLKSHGLKTYFDGIGAVTAGCMPAHALYFGSYELLKDFLQVNDEEVHPFHFAFIGASSTLWHDLIMTPFDVIKQRQQILESGFLSTITNLLKKEGIKSLYRSFPITYLMNVPFQAVFFASNETFRVLICTKENHTFASHFSAAALAGAVSVALINPLDVIKTKLQTQTCFNKENKIKYFNFVDTIKTIRLEEGIRGFYKGLVPRLCMQTLSGATAWASYEYIKKRLLKYSDLL